MKRQDFLSEARKFTDDKLRIIRQELKAALADSQYNDEITLIATGSYGRGEASEESDLDWFLIFDKDLDPAELSLRVYPMRINCSEPKNCSIRILWSDSKVLVQVRVRRQLK